MAESVKASCLLRVSRSPTTADKPLRFCERLFFFFIVCHIEGAGNASVRWRFTIIGRAIQLLMLHRWFYGTTAFHLLNEPVKLSLRLKLFNTCRLEGHIGGLKSASTYLRAPLMLVNI